MPAFEPDRRFDPLTDAAAFLFGEFVARGAVLPWIQSDSGLLYRFEVPRYLFRGECGAFETTMLSADATKRTPY